MAPLWALTGKSDARNEARPLNHDKFLLRDPALYTEYTHFVPLDCALTDTGHASVRDVMCSDRACVAFENTLVREMP